MTNQNPEQIARDHIDQMLADAGWEVQDLDDYDPSKKGVALREHQNTAGSADYLLIVHNQPVGVIEAKKEELGFKLTQVEEQTKKYITSNLKFFGEVDLYYGYESTGTVTRFTNFRDPKPRSREVFSFHRPETFEEWLKQDASLRTRLHDLPELIKDGLRDCQIDAIENLDQSFKDARPRALIQMATGSGKTWTAITFIYRLLKHCNANRVLFLVDTKNLGEQAEGEFFAYTPNDDQRKFTELYTVQRLSSSFIDKDAKVCISTIQRMYSILKGKELDEEAEEDSMFESDMSSGKPVEVVYNDNVPIETFDFIVIDECHRSIYNLWKQVLDYFDAFLIGLTATPDNRTFAFFNENVVSEYKYETAVGDGVLVPFTQYKIITRITKDGSTIEAGEDVQTRDNLTFKERWHRPDEVIEYKGKDLDRSVVNKSQIRQVIKKFKEVVFTELFPTRKELPKTLIFAKRDSHAEDIIEIVREEFGEGNDFCKKVTYQAIKPKEVIKDFRKSYNPRVAVTVDMIATGTDIRPLEIVMFMRDVKSRTYYEQMVGRGTRTDSYDDLKEVSGSATSAKTHFVLIDAVGVTDTIKVDTKPLETKPTVSFDNLIKGVMMGANRDADSVSSLASRLARLDKQLTKAEREEFKEYSGGMSLQGFTAQLINSVDPDQVKADAQQKLDAGEAPNEEMAVKAAEKQRIDAVADVLNGKLIKYLVETKKRKEQIIDTVNLDEVVEVGWKEDIEERSQFIVESFRDFCDKNRDELEALKIFYNTPNRRHEVTFKMMKSVLEALKEHKPPLAPVQIWEAYAHLEKVSDKAPLDQLTALVSLIRRVTGVDSVLSNYQETVRRNFQRWAFKKQEGTLKFTEEQMGFLHMIRDHVANSMQFTKDDFDVVEQGALGRAYQAIGEGLFQMIDELNQELVA